MVGAKAATIRCILRRFFGPPLYMGSIAAFHWTTTIVLVFCGILQGRYIELPQYMCFSGVKLRYSGAPKTYCNKYSILRDTIAVV